MKLVLAVLWRDLLLAWRARIDLLVALSFFVVVASIFPIAVGSDPQRLHLIGSGVIWVAALLAGLLALPRLFAQDFDSGILEQLMLSPEPAVLWVLAKIAAHWLTTGLPLVVITPVLALMYQLDPGATFILAATLALGTPALSLLGAIGAALTLGLRGGSSLLALLVLPLSVPVLIFGMGAVEAWTSGMPASAYLALLGGFSLGTTVLAPLACAAALRLACE